jgi:hypothetical protein
MYLSVYNEQNLLTFNGPTPEQNILWFFLLSTAPDHQNHIFAPFDISLRETLPPIYLVSVSESAV